MSWYDEIDREMMRARHAQHAGNAGLVRTCARRAAGIAITAYDQMRGQPETDADFLRRMRAFAADPSLPPEVRAAAHRLQARLAPDFTSPSIDPISDAHTITTFVRTALPPTDRT